MSEQDDIDIRRAKHLFSRQEVGEWDEYDQEIHRIWIDMARAIRLSDESAGYITVKLKGAVNEKDRMS